MNFLINYSFILSSSNNNKLIYKRFDHYEILVDEENDFCYIYFNNINMFNNYQKITLYQGKVLTEPEFITIMNLIKP